MALLTLCRGQLPLTCTHTNTHSNTQAVTSRGRPAVPHSLEGSVPSMGWLASQKPLIPLWTQPMVWKDQPWENSKGGVSSGGWEGMGLHNTFFFSFTFFVLFFLSWEKTTAVEKIHFPGHISPGIQTIQRLSGDGAADSSCNIYQVLDTWQRDCSQIRLRESRGEQWAFNNTIFIEGRKKGFHCFGFALIAHNEVKVMTFNFNLNGVYMHIVQTV